MRITAALFFALFGIAAIVQWNDPDPMLWILGYGSAAALSLATALDRSWFPGNLVLAIVLGLWGATLVPSLVGAESDAFTSFQMREVRHEEPREALGLALASGWCGFMAWRSRRPDPETDRD